jgi:ferredoxin
MANFKDRYPLNIQGKYYITNQCTDCDLCREYAPNNIKRDGRTGISYVFRQPETPEESAACQMGVEGCPTEAVGNDGDTFDWDKTPIYDWNKLYKKEGIHFDIRVPIIGVEKSWWKFWR